MFDKTYMLLSWILLSKLSINVAIIFKIHLICKIILANHKNDKINLSLIIC